MPTPLTKAPAAATLVAAVLLLSAPPAAHAGTPPTKGGGIQDPTTGQSPKPGQDKEVVQGAPTGGVPMPGGGDVGCARLMAEVRAAYTKAGASKTTADREAKEAQDQCLEGKKQQQKK
jgi:hypothetical protein